MKDTEDPRTSARLPVPTSEKMAATSSQRQTSVSKLKPVNTTRNEPSRKLNSNRDRKTGAQKRDDDNKCATQAAAAKQTLDRSDIEKENYKH